MVDIKKIAPLFFEWDKALIWSCLHGCMGYAIADNNENPSAAQIVVGDFCFFAGIPNNDLAAQAAAPIIVPQNQEWSKNIESAFGVRVEKTQRYAMKKELECFDQQKLIGYTKSLPEGCSLRLFDKEIYDNVIREEWSKDLCSQFAGYNDYSQRGIGAAVLFQGELVSGASSYTVYNGGIEIEIDTKPEFRQMGFAAACGAKLILECLYRGLYPSWDAHDLRSVSLAEKLGYHMDHPYTAYLTRR